MFLPLPKISAVLAFAMALPAQPIKHVVVFGVDGLSATAVDQRRTPNMQKLMKRGSYTLHARAVLPTVSSPNWAAMIMGAGPDFTGITSNEWQPDHFEIAPFCRDGGNHPPTIFGVIRKAKPDESTALFTDWDGFVRLVEPLAPTKVFLKQDDAGGTVTEAIRFLIGQHPALLFIHVDSVDHAGHTMGWYTPAYFTAVHAADDLLGKVLRAVGDAGLQSDTVVLVTADHGGHEKKHGGMMQSDIEIPWIAAGPDIPANREITSPVSTQQTAPTIAAWLGLDSHPCWVARPIPAVLAGPR